MTDNRLVLTTVESQQAARTLANTLIERQLAACVNIVGPIESVYRWKGNIEQTGEFLLLIKTTVAQFERLQNAILEEHAYDVPEVISLAIEDGNPAYLRWLEDSTSST